MEQKDIWAVIESGMHRYIGVVQIKKNYKNFGIESATEDEILDSLNKPLMLAPIYELVSTSIILRDSSNGQPVPKNMMQVAAFALGTSQLTPLFVMATAIQFFSDMDEADRTNYQRLVEDAKHHLLKTRAREIGIEIPELSGKIKV